ncbi:MAG: hypothetical protein RL154_1167 [Pseudomonadota bacterium]|jgi:hypothetical protein
MSTFKIAYSCLCFVEFDNEPKKALEYAYGENFMTYKGINRRDEPFFKGWLIVDSYVAIYKRDTESASLACSIDIELENLVVEYYQAKYWSILLCPLILDQKSANRLFTFSALVGCTTAARIAQIVLGCTPDGVFGSKSSIPAINNIKTFNDDFDFVCSLFLRSKAQNNPALMPNLTGWLNRITKVANYA